MVQNNNEVALDEIPDTAFNRGLQSGLDAFQAITIAKGEHEESLETAAYLLYRYDDVFLNAVGTRRDYLNKAALLRQHFSDNESRAS